MPKKRFSVERIISHLREAEVFLAQGRTIGQVCRPIGISEQSYYRWRREYGGLKVDQARRLKELERENTRLHRAVLGVYRTSISIRRVPSGRLSHTNSPQKTYKSYRYCKRSVNDPKRIFTGVRRRYVWRNIFKIDEAQFMIAAGRIALYASHL